MKWRTCFRVPEVGMKTQALLLPQNLESLLFHNDATASSRHYFRNAFVLPKSFRLSAATTFVSIHSNLVSNFSAKKPFPSHVMWGVREENHAFLWRQLSADDIVSGEVDVIGWTVRLGVATGIVSEFIQVPGPRSVSDYAGTTLTWLRVVESAASCRDDLGEQMETHVLEGEFSSGRHAIILKQQKGKFFNSSPLATEILVPVVDEFVKKIDVESRTLIIFPPKGLLELARRPESVKRLRSAILEFCMQNPPENVRKSSREMRINNVVYMPTKRQLQQAGMQWLLKEINAVGGLLYVAQTLNLHVNRRPAGFWENLMRVDVEIECFIWECWTKKFDKRTETHYYWNPVTDEVCQKQPPFPGIADFVKTKGTIMPRQSTVMAAKRWDLHHAIIFHGGYKEVGYALKRWTVYVHGREPIKPILPKHMYRNLGDVKRFNSETLSTEQYGLMTLRKVKLSIKKIMQSRGLSDFPTYKDLQKHDQNLYASVKGLGGRRKVANSMNITLRRSERGRWSSLSVAGAALRSYICSKIAEERNMQFGYNEENIWEEAYMDGSLSLPTHSQVLNDARPDLHYVLQKFGRSSLAEHLKIPQRVMLPLCHDAS